MFARAGITYRQLRSKKGSRREQGFSAAEILLAATVFGCLVTVITGAMIYGRQGTASAGDRARALALAEGACAAVRNIRDHAWANLPGTGVYYLDQGSGVWTIGSTPEPPIDIFTRQINLAVIDSDRRHVQCQVNWTTNGVDRQVAVTTRLTNWRNSITPPDTPGPIIMAYSKTTTTPAYRIWQGLNWSGESNANAVVGTVNQVVVKSSRTRNEAILGTQTSTGAIYVQVYDGDSLTWGPATQVGTGPTTTRSFDIAYEKNGDRAVIAYTPSSGSADFAYRTWNGTTLSGATNVTGSPTSGAINWIEMDQNPLSASNEIALILLDANADVYGMRWNGTSWVHMDTAVIWDTNASTATRKGIDVEYEQTSGEALFMWGDSVSTDQYYRTWNGTTLANAVPLDIAGTGGVANWVQLAARPGSNEIMYGLQDAGGDFNTRVWSGSAWDAAGSHPEHDATVENVASRNFDLVWETHASNPGVAWVLWGNGSNISSRRWDSGAWGTIANLSGSDDTSFVRLRADPVSGAVFTGNYQNATSAVSARDISERHLTGGGSAWSSKGIMWGGPTSSDPVHFRIDIAMP
jgi:hypothetical protein